MVSKNSLGSSELICAEEGRDQTHPMPGRLLPVGQAGATCLLPSGQGLCCLWPHRGGNCGESSQAAFGRRVVPVCPAEPRQGGALFTSWWGKRSLFSPHRCSMFLGAGGQSKPQHRAISGGQLGFQGVHCLRSPSRAGADLLGVGDSLKWSQQLLLCPWLSSDLFSTTISCFPVSPPSPSPAMSHSPRRAALDRVGGFQLLELRVA